MRARVQVRVSGVLRNAPYILNLDCDHYINNSKALREAMCFMMTGKNVCYVQFPLQVLDGDYSNRDTVFFNVISLIFPIVSYTGN